jgi:hypothetical protein
MLSFARIGDRHSARHPKQHTWYQGKGKRRALAWEIRQTALTSWNHLVLHRQQGVPSPRRKQVCWRLAGLSDRTCHHLEMTLCGLVLLYPNGRPDLHEADMLAFNNQQSEGLRDAALLTACLLSWIAGAMTARMSLAAVTSRTPHRGPCLWKKDEVPTDQLLFQEGRFLLPELLENLHHFY